MLRLPAVIVAALLVTAGCSAAPDRAGGQATTRSRELTVASAYTLPRGEVQAWLDTVTKASRGTLDFEVEPHWAEGSSDFEAQVVRDVASGRADVGWVGARVFDTLDVTDFQPLLAPFLIDSLDLEEQVFDAGIPQEMLGGVDAAGVVGVAVLPGPVRRMLGVSGPIAGPGDFSGAVIGTQASEVAEQTFRALGAEPRLLPVDPPLTGLDGYEQHTDAIALGHFEHSATDVTTDLDLWPRPVVLIMNPAVYDGLSRAQRKALADSAGPAVSSAWAAIRHEEADGAHNVCGSSLGLVEATDDDLAAMRSSVQPVYDDIAAAGDNESVLAQIEQLKDQGLGAPDDLVCAGAEAAPDSSASPIPDGRYRTTLTRVETTCLSPSEHAFDEIVLDLTLSEGSQVYLTERQGGPEAEPLPAFGGTYRVFRDRIELSSDIPLVMTWSLDKGQLRFTDPVGGGCGDKQVWTTHPWVRQE